MSQDNHGKLTFGGGGGGVNLLIKLLMITSPAEPIKLLTLHFVVFVSVGGNELTFCFIDKLVRAPAPAN